MKKLSEISTWKSNLGLLPVHLKQGDENNLLMLNGGYGDFCLQINPEADDIETYYSKSWSSNTKNYLVLDGDNVKIYNWLKDKTEPEIASKDKVINNFDKFYSYLLNKSYKSSRDVVPYIIDIFRQFRNLTGEKANPVEALNLLFALLTSLEEDITSLDKNKWNINDVHIPSGFGHYTDQLKKGVSGIAPELDLILRHSAGALFQEAQKEVVFFDGQLNLFGGMSNKLSTKSNLYSSVHYTPAYLSRTIVENALREIEDLRKLSLKIFDPACGSSEFLIEALKQLRELKYKGNIEIIGWDSSETAINTSNFLLQYEKRTIWGEQLQFNIKLVEDSLTEEWDNDYDLILMNPPFISWELLKEKSSRDAIKETLGRNFKGKLGLASAFFHKTIKHLAENGVIGCVLPSSILTLDSYSKLRDEIQELFSIKLLGKLGNFVFEDALTDVSILVGKKPKINSNPTILWTRNEKGNAQNALRDYRKMIYSNATRVDKSDYSIFQPSIFPIIKESWKPISLEDNELLKTMERLIASGKLVRTADIFSVKQGIRTGNNSVFKITKKQFDLLPNDEQYYFRPATDNDTIKNKLLIIKNYVWYPYDENGLIITTEDEFQSKVPTFYNQIFSNKNELINRARKDNSNWWHLSEHRAWLREKNSRLISAEFGKSDSFAFDKKGNFVVERGNAWIPKKDFSDIDYYFYLALFSSPFYDKLLSIYSKQLLAGWDLGLKYTKNIPIPNVHSEEVRNSEAYSKLVKIGQELSDGNSYVKGIAEDIVTKYFYPKF